MGITYDEISFNFLKDISADHLRRLNDFMSKREGNTLFFCQSGGKVAALLALNACISCGHPKQRSLDFGFKIGLTDPLLKSETEALIMEGRL